jgi:SAM-dependent methyltransferase
MSTNLTDKDYWHNFWAKDPRPRDLDEFIRHGFMFDEVLSLILPSNCEFTAIELGCFPGSFLAYLNMQFGYRVFGLDISEDLHIVREKLAAAGVLVEGLIRADVMNMPFDSTFNVVTSFGLVEHFTNPREVINHHCNMVAAGGYLVLSVPNFRGAQYWLHRWFDSENLVSHNLDVMYPAILRQWTEANNFTILYCGYFKTFNFWILNEPASLFRRVACRLFMHFANIIKKILVILKANAIPNPWFSPHIILVAKKSNGEK